MYNRKRPAHAPRPLQSQRRKDAQKLAIVTLALVLASCFGCGRSEQLNIEYGSRRGSGLTSVNGTIVLSELFSQQGHRVSSWGRLSPKLDKDEVLIWAPDRYGAPTARERNYLEHWLAKRTGRTLVYIGRDYDAHLHYWRAIVATAAPGDNRARARKQLARETAVKQTQRQAELQQNVICPWFNFVAGHAPSEIARIEGPWAFGMETTQVNIKTFRRLLIDEDLDPRIVDSEVELDEATELPKSNVATETGADNAPEITEAELRAELAKLANVAQSPDSNSKVRPLLWSDDGQLLAAELRATDWNGSRIIVVANGSWLLNYPLLHPVHRQLALNLIAEVGAASDVCFLESGADELAISDSDVNVPLALQAFQVFPINLLVVQLLAVGILYCFCVFPIFGRPRSLPSEQLSDFGKHVTAVGEMLERNQQLGYAHARIQQYYELVSQRSKNQNQT